jgi:hypothetical protein
MRAALPPVPALLLTAALALQGCAGRPGPGPAGDPAGEVTGSLLLEFPDGFLGQPARTVRSNILLHVRNLSTGERYLRLLRDGRFALPAAGELLLVSYEYSLAGPEFSCYLNDQIGIGLRAEPGRRLDLGQIRILYTRPRRSHTATFARSTTFEEGGLVTARPGSFLGRLRQDYWQYERTVLR